MRQLKTVFGNKKPKKDPLNTNNLHGGLYHKNKENRPSLTFGVNLKKLVLDIMKQQQKTKIISLKQNHKWWII